MKPLAAAAAAILVPISAASCPVCFGKSADTAGIASGLVTGIFVLLFFTFLIMGWLAAAVMRIEKNRALAEQAGLS